VISIEGKVKALAQASVSSVRWLGLTCKIEVESKTDVLLIDLRTKLADSTTSLVKAKAVKEGKCSLMITDDDHEGLMAMVVILDKDANVLAKQATTVGGDN
jgi:hypothetical protein